ncbi:MAG: ATP-binding protein, partial [bacterium]|nr:ATP-binding protein [bacterium]
MLERGEPLVGQAEGDRVIVADQVHGGIRIAGDGRRNLAGSTVPARLGQPFVGRETELGQVDESFRGKATEVLVLHGEPGVGKSELALEYARQFHERYPGGTHVVRLSEGLPTDLASLGRACFGLSDLKDLSLARQCELALAHIGEKATLLIYDDAPRPESVAPWLPVVGRQCHVLVTTNWERWPWSSIPIAPLSEQAAHELVRELAGDEVAARYGDQLVRSAAGLPVQLGPSTRLLASHLRRHPGSAPEMALTGESEGSFGRAWSRLAEDEKLLLRVAVMFAADRLLPDLLEHRLVEGAAWTPDRFSTTWDGCMDVHLVEATPQPHVHQLVARFVRQQTAPPVPAELVEGHVRQFLEVTSAFAASPADPDLAAKMLAFPLARSRWPERLPGTEGGDEHRVGNAAVEQGRNEEALPWFQRAVEKKQQGDVHGRVDHE